MTQKIIILLLIISICGLNFPTPTKATECPDVTFLFVRGSGEMAGGENYGALRSSIEEKMRHVALDYNFDEIDYPAVGINVGVAIGAFFSGGESNKFGESVNRGVRELVDKVNNSQCENTRFVLSGYSQGAMVISKALDQLNPNKVIYAATFGDPKLYLPEGVGTLPPACIGQNLSEYRRYVPVCTTHDGILGGYKPYRPESFIGKVGTWCNKNDIICSGKFSLDDHLNYGQDGIYEDASRYIFHKVTEYFGIKNIYVSPHDTLILIDSTGSMTEMIDEYKDEALRLAEETLQVGGRVALYDYRDLAEGYAPYKRCDFDTCTMGSFLKGLDDIVADAGGDSLESTLSASYHSMVELNWQFGSTKSLIILTDDGFHSPDLDGTTLKNVIDLSREIDPVRFYIITNSSVASQYEELASETGGKVITDLGKLSMLSQEIMQRYDSLPEVEYSDESVDYPTIVITEQTESTPGEFKVSFETDAEETIVIVDDMILGRTPEKRITISDLDLENEHNLRLVPLANNVRGKGAETILQSKNNPAENQEVGIGSYEPEVITEPLYFVPKVPNTGAK